MRKSFLRLCKKIFLIVSFMPLFLCSCGTSINYPLTSEIASASLIGELTHVQYWDEYDKWDVSSLSIEFILHNQDVINLPITDSHFEYSFSPLEPASKVDSFSIINLNYIDDNNNVFLVLTKKTFNISIIPYPYSQKKISNHSVVVLAIVFVLLFILVFEISALLFIKDKKI